MGIMEKKMETTILSRDYIGIILGLYRDYIGKGPRMVLGRL